MQCWKTCVSDLSQFGTLGEEICCIKSFLQLHWKLWRSGKAVYCNVEWSGWLVSICILGQHTSNWGQSEPRKGPSMTQPTTVTTTVRGRCSIFAFGRASVYLYLASLSLYLYLAPLSLYLYLTSLSCICIRICTWLAQKTSVVGRVVPTTVKGSSSIFAFLCASLYLYLASLSLYLYMTCSTTERCQQPWRVAARYPQ